MFDFTRKTILFLFTELVPVTPDILPYVLQAFDIVFVLRVLDPSPQIHVFRIRTIPATYTHTHSSREDASKILITILMH